VISDDLKTALQTDFGNSQTATLAIASLSGIELAEIAKNILKARAQAFMKELTQEQLEYIQSPINLPSLKRIATEIINESSEP